MQFAYLAVVREGKARTSERTNRGLFHYREQVLEGIEQAPGAIHRLYSAENTGKLVLRLSGAHATA